MGDFPSGLVSVPVALDDNGWPYKMMFYGGLVGNVYDKETSSISPTSGWLVTDVTEEKE